MIILLCGLLLWTVVHLLPALAPGHRKMILGKTGEKAYKALFSILIIFSAVLMVTGWRHTVPGQLYLPPVELRPLVFILMAAGFILMGAAQYRTRIKRLIRHPQLSGFALWGVAHLLANGDSRSLLLFGWLTTWALLEIVLINRRDGAYRKPEAPGLVTEITGLLISLLVFGLFVYLHPYLSGVSLV